MTSATGLVLLYHRVADLGSDPQRLAVTPRHFAEHLEMLRTCCSPMPLRELVAGASMGSLPRRAVAVTFDDGYADNLENAKPLLERFDVPATVFVTTGYVGTAREFWWDDLERLLLLPGRLPASLRISAGRTEQEWNLNGSTVYEAADSERHAAWHVEQDGSPTRRHQIYRSLCRALQPLSSEERDAALCSLAVAAKDTLNSRISHRVLTPDEIVQLTGDGLVAAGAHTVSHSRLSALPRGAQQAEIVESRARLQEITGRDVLDFAYPFGCRSDYSSATIALVRKAGFAAAYSTAPGLVDPGRDRFLLPRMLVRDWDGETFSRKTGEWLGA